MRVSYFKSICSEGKEMKLDEVLASIKNGNLKAQVEEARNAKHIISTEEYRELKKRLPAFTPSVLVEGKRTKGSIKKYNSMMVLDINNMGVEDAKKMKKTIIKFPYTYSCFISPGGDGLKVLVKTDSTVNNHESIFTELAGWYEKYTGVDINRSGKDVSQLCFLSYDPEIFINQQSETFSSQLASNSKELAYDGFNTTDEAEKIFKNAVDFTNNIKDYVQGNCNNFVFLLASNCNRMGLDIETALGLICNHYSDLPQTESIATVKSAYQNTNDHGIYASFAPVATFAPNQLNKPFDIENTPYIPLEVYGRLPKFLQKGAALFDSHREKDVFLIGAIGILSGCFPNVKGIYDRKEHYPNLNCFIIAPAASGKGALNYSRALGNVINSSYENDSELPKMIYNDMDVQKQTLFIPADSSSAALKRCLKVNNETGIICETEADTLSSTLKQDWGGYSDLIRKAFHHEPISYARMDKDQGYGNIEKPKLSICLSGTPGQVPALIGSAENGLFSRMIYYVFKTEVKWKDVSPLVNVINLDKEFELLADEVYKFYHLYSGKKLEFQYQEDHWIDHNSKYSKLLGSTIDQFGDDAAGVLYRMGLIHFRTAMVLSVIRRAETSEIPDRIICSDEDYEVASKLTDVFLQHGLYLFQKLPGQKGTVDNSGYSLLLKVLPKGVEFTLNDAVNIASQIKIKSRSVSNYLKKGIGEGEIQQNKANGPYFIKK